LVHKSLRADLTFGLPAPFLRNPKGKHMTDHITLRPCGIPQIVKAGDMVLGTTDKAVELYEGGRGPTFYIPRADMDMSTLERTDRATTCPWKGVASYYSVVTPTGKLDNAVWSYESPKSGLEAIAGHLAFYPSVTVTPA
jgi:uncharacterized protein (DUF427 family)